MENKPDRRTQKFKKAVPIILGDYTAALRWKHVSLGSNEMIGWKERIKNGGTDPGSGIRKDYEKELRLSEPFTSVSKNNRNSSALKSGVWYGLEIDSSAYLCT